jgi:hypothetical protein
MYAQAGNQFITIARRAETVVRSTFQPSGALATGAEPMKNDDAAKLGVHKSLKQQSIGALAARAHQQRKIEARQSGALSADIRSSRRCHTKASTRKVRRHRLKACQRLAEHEDAWTGLDR